MNQGIYVLWKFCGQFQGQGAAGGAADENNLVAELLADGQGLFGAGPSQDA